MSYRQLFQLIFVLNKRGSQEFHGDQRKARQICASQIASAPQASVHDNQSSQDGNPTAASTKEPVREAGDGVEYKGPRPKSGHFF
jgi:hypothetical protein